MNKLAIHVDHIGKKYQIGELRSSYHTLRDSISSVFSNQKRNNDIGQISPGHIWALRNISFDVEQGQVLGIIGKNGAGKSTLLKILSRVTEPTEGRVEIIGRVGSLLEVGTGFHPELTGRENIFLNGAILGMKKEEIQQKFDEIVSFAEVEKFIDTPVKRYSSGMYLRLAFAVAAHLEPEILVVDEVLAVGDAEFQKKCIGKMSHVAKEGRTVLFVSHNMSAILRLTNETLVIDKGHLVMRGTTQDAVNYYLSNDQDGKGIKTWNSDEIPKSAEPFRPLAMRLINHAGMITDSVRSTEQITIEIEYQLAKAIQGLRVGIYVLTSQGEYVFTSFDTDNPEKFSEFAQRDKGNYVSRSQIPANLLNSGKYVIGMNASAFKIKTFFHDEQALSFNVDISGAPGTQWPETRLGSIRPELDWEISKK